MNYSVFKVQQAQGGRSGIFWEKETIPKRDRRYGYKKKDQRFPIRRHAQDTHYVETGLETLTPDELPVKKPTPKDFIKRNRQKISQKNIPDANQTVTLTQQQLNAILKSVGKVAGGRENAVKISIDGKGDKNDITIESPRREKGKAKKQVESKEDEEHASNIYALLGGDKDDRRSRIKADSGLSSQGSDDDDASYVERKRGTRRRKNSLERRGPSKRRDSDDDDRDNRQRNRSKKRSDYDDDRDHRSRRKGTRYSDDEIDDDYRESKSKRHGSKVRRDIEDDDDESNENNNRIRGNYSKRGHKHNEDDDDNVSDNDREYSRHRERSDKGRRNKNNRHDSGSRERLNKKSVEREIQKTSRDREDVGNTSVDEDGKTPRDAVGIPSDLSWRHMTKAERRRLTLARQKLNADEERKEEERIHGMMAKLQDLPTMSKKQVVRSDPVSRETAHRNTRPSPEEPQSRDQYRRSRRTRSPSPPVNKHYRTPERSPEPPHSPDSSPKLPVAKQHMTLAEKKRMEWEKERVESVQIQKRGDFDPWGRPGAGAPLRTKSGHVAADYKYRQEYMHGSEDIPENDEVPSHTTSAPAREAPPSDEPSRQAPPTNRQPLPQGKLEDTSVPHAMRSSFVFGQAYPDANRLTNRKEEEKKLWLAELEKQIEEKRLKEMKNAEVKQEENTWADKFGQSHRPIAFPDQPPKITAPMVSESMDRSQSAPDDMTAVDESNHAPATFIRGQNVPVDSATKKEMEEKRKQYLEYQTALKAQVNEKERQKQLARQKKLEEDLEGEQKLREEREMLQKQFDTEQQKIRQKEQQRQNQTNMLKVAMDEAQAKAMQEKYQRKMQHLEKGGHDTTKLRENLEDQMTSRIEELHTKRERDLLRARRLREEYPNYPEEITANMEEFSNNPVAKQPAKVTPRDDATVMGMETPHVPGLDLATSRTHLPHQGQNKTNMAVTAMTETRRGGETSHEPYTENRVLTPTRLRGAPSKPWSDPISPRREFGTQTGNAIQHDAADIMLDVYGSKRRKDADEAIAVLNRNYDRQASEVNIEYRIERGKRVRVVSAPKEEMRRKAKGRQPHPPPPRHASPHQHSHEQIKRKETDAAIEKHQLDRKSNGPVRVGSRPMWNYKNAKQKKATKQSEKDPFYERKKRESDMRRMKREAKLLALVDANRDLIPDYYNPGERSRNVSSHSDYGGGTPRGQSYTRRSKSHSPARSMEGADYLAVHQEPNIFPLKSKTPARSRSRSPPLVHAPHPPQTEHPQTKSPLIPALKHRLHANDNFEDAFEKNDISRRPGKTNYGDVDPVSGPLQNNDFVPFTRTIDVLDPQRADEPMPVSREATKIANARRAYHEGLKPDRYGNRVDMYQDQQRNPATDPNERNPLLRPGLVTDHPTTRQGQILQQLSTLKQSLMQRQRELETFSPTDFT